MSIVVGTPCHLCKKEENVAFTGVAGFVSVEVTVERVHQSYDGSSRQESV